jgi:hypothetical protein
MKVFCTSPAISTTYRYGCVGIWAGSRNRKQETLGTKVPPLCNMLQHVLLIFSAMTLTICGLPIFYKYADLGL